MNISPEEGQKQFDKWRENLPKEIEDLYSSISKKVKKIQTFDLLSNIAFYNHLHNSEEYQDSRGDKHFFIPEVVALLCLKNEFVKKTTVSKDDFQSLLKEIQEETLKYCTFKSFNQHKDSNPFELDTISQITDSMSREEMTVRNPGLPDHHLIFMEELFHPLENTIFEIFGFKISDSTKIRKSISKMLNEKQQEEHDKILLKMNNFEKEIEHYKKTSKRKIDDNLSKKQLEDFSKISNEHLRESLFFLLNNNLHFKFSEIYTFTSNELANYSKVNLSSVKAYLKLLSCEFPSLTQRDEIFEPITLLRTKPILKNESKYLIPSIPLHTWALEEVLEKKINQNSKLNNKYRKTKHDFLLNKGFEYFKKIIPNSTFFPPNLFYKEDDNRYETDGLIIYDKVLFIIEAKASKLSLKSKSGHKLKTEDHLKDIIKHSYNQGIRTLDYIEKNETAVFETKNGKKHTIDKNDFNDIIIVTLTLEPIGSLSMLVKATNEIGYFGVKHFPWIISIYDLIIIADLFDNPILLFHYIKRRKRFLSEKIFSTFEELDLIAYFLLNGLYIEHTVNDAKKENVNMVYFAPETDYINDYYMFKFGHKEKDTVKPSSFLTKEFNNFLNQIDKSNIEHKVKISLLLLEFNKKSIDQLMSYVEKVKEQFKKDKQPHDCAIYTESQKGIGFTFMVGADKPELDFRLYNYCMFKLDQLNSNIWIGLGDTSLVKNKYNFECMFFASRGFDTKS